MGSSAVVGLSEQGVSLGLTTAQVARVIAEADAAGTGSTGLSTALAHPRELLSSPLLGDKSLSRSLLLGLAILIAFPGDGGERGVKEVAQGLELPISTTHRYVRTLLTAGLLEQRPGTRRYRRRDQPGSGVES